MSSEFEVIRFSPFDESLVMDKELQARVKTDKGTVEDYAEEMRNGVKFPPIVVFAELTDELDENDEPITVYRVADGWHRLLAAKASETDIDAEVHEGDATACLRYALSANTTHGLRRTHADVQRCVKLALENKALKIRSDRAIAELIGVSQPTVGKYRALLKEDSPAKVVDKSGKEVPVKRGRKDVGGNGEKPQPRTIKRGESPVKNVALKRLQTCIERGVKAIESYEWESEEELEKLTAPFVEGLQILSEYVETKEA